MIALDRKTIKNLSVFLLAFAAITLLLYHFGWVDLLTDKQSLLRFIDQHRDYAAYTFVGLQALQVVFAPIPGEVTGFAGGVIFGVFWGIVYSTIGLSLGSWIAFSLSKIVGRPLVERIVSPETLRKYDYVMKHKGLFLAFLLFTIPGFPKDYLCYILGLGHMGHGAFLIVSTLGRLLGVSLLTLGGSFFRNRQYEALFTLSGFSILLILFAMVYRGKLEFWFRKMRAAHYLRSRANRSKRQ
ncbi:MAG TPA: TVP38/TMEM64 family protein [Nitrospirota bacterium]|nr:TVP38/TMEM64 family protein [Nitrospirota bacterium]